MKKKRFMHLLTIKEALAEKNSLKIFQKIFGDIKKINSSLHCKTKI